jgi:hypothetical protein
LYQARLAYQKPHSQLPQQLLDSLLRASLDNRKHTRTHAQALTQTHTMRKCREREVDKKDEDEKNINLYE